MDIQYLYDLLKNSETNNEIKYKILLENKADNKDLYQLTEMALKDRDSRLFNMLMEVGTKVRIEDENHDVFDTDVYEDNLFNLVGYTRRSCVVTCVKISDPGDALLKIDSILHFEKDEYGSILYMPRSMHRYYRADVEEEVLKEYAKGFRNYLNMKPFVLGNSFVSDFGGKQKLIEEIVKLNNSSDLPLVLFNDYIFINEGDFKYLVETYLEYADKTNLHVLDSLIEHFSYSRENAMYFELLSQVSLDYLKGVVADLERMKQEIIDQRKENEKGFFRRLFNKFGK